MRTTACVIFAALLLTLLAVSPARAEWYASGYAGAAFSADTDVDVSVAAFGLSATDTFKDVELDTSVVFGGKVGHYLEVFPQFGLELEAYHFAPDVDNQTVQTNLSGPTQTGTADIDVTGIGLNGLYRFQLLKESAYPRGRLQPYLGVGLGIFIANLETLVLTQVDDDTDTQVGFQGIAGARYFVSKTVSLFAEYKFIQTSDFEFELSEGALTGRIETDLTSHLIYAGIAFHF